MKKCIITALLLSLVLCACSNKKESAQKINIVEAQIDNTDKPVESGETTSDNTEEHSINDNEHNDNEEEQLKSEDKQVESGEEQTESQNSIDNSDIIEFSLHDNSIPGEMVECKIIGNTLEIKRSAFSSAIDVDTRVNETSIELDDSQLNKLLKAVDNVNKSNDFEVEEALELDLSKIIDTKEFELLYYDYSYGEGEEKEAAQEKMHKQSEELTKEINYVAATDGINRLIQDETYKNQSIDRKRMLVLDLLKDMKNSDWIEWYDENSVGNEIKYIDTYGNENNISLDE